MAKDPYSPVRVVDEDEVPALGRLLSQALHFPNDSGMKHWMEDVVGLKDFLVLLKNDELAAGLAVLPMGQTFGGRFVSTGGICCVGVAPETRGSGSGFALMQGMLHNLKERDFALSTLFPSTTTFYRKLGYERAGTRADWRLALAEVHLRERELEIRPMARSDEKALRALQLRWALSHEGNLRRHEGYFWRRWLEPQPVEKGEKPSPLHRYVVERDGTMTGYVFYRQGGQFEPMTVVDWAAEDPPTMRRLWSFFADHGTMASELRWRGGFPDVFAAVLPEQRIRCAGVIDWMLRIVDVKRALEERGYSSALKLSFLLEIEDELLPWNHGRFAFGVAEGGGRCRPLEPHSSSGKPPIKLGIRALAALYAGRATVRSLRWGGLIEGPEDDLARFQTAFPPTAPWMADSF